jgi:hypothetical protein
VTGADSAPQFSTAEFEPELADSNAHFVRGILFGVGGALAGLALYATVVIVTNYEIGLVSLAVGWLVGKGILAGSRGRTGRRYQIVAVLLTYLSVSMSTVPILIYHIIKLAPAAQGTPEAGVAPAEPDGPPMGLAGAVGQLAWVGLISPFLSLQDMPGGLISIIILAVGLQIAWKMTGSRRVAIEQAIAAPDSGNDEKPTSLGLGR